MLCFETYIEPSQAREREREDPESCLQEPVLDRGLPPRDDNTNKSLRRKELRHHACMHVSMQNNKVEDASEEAGREEGNAYHHRKKKGCQFFAPFLLAAESLKVPSLPYPRTFLERETPFSIKPPANKRKCFFSSRWSMHPCMHACMIYELRHAVTPFVSDSGLLFFTPPRCPSQCYLSPDRGCWKGQPMSLPYLGGAETVSNQLSALHLSRHEGMMWLLPTQIAAFAARRP